MNDLDKKRRRKEIKISRSLFRLSIRKVNESKTTIAFNKLCTKNQFNSSKDVSKADLGGEKLPSVAMYDDA